MNVTVVDTVMIPSDMVCVLIPDVAVIINTLETVNRYVVVFGLLPFTRSVCMNVYDNNKKLITVTCQLSMSKFFHHTDHIQQ